MVVVVQVGAGAGWGELISPRNEQRGWLSEYELVMEDAIDWGPIVFDSQEAKYDIVDCTRSTIKGLWRWSVEKSGGAEVMVVGVEDEGGVDV